MNILGIDWGSRRVGMALGSDEAKLARPLATLPNGTGLLGEFKNICAEHKVDRIVLGLPRNMQGEETAQSQQVRQFGKILSQDLNIAVVYQDESLTSQVAEENASTKSEDLDAHAAQLILQDYLDKLS